MNYELRFGFRVPRLFRVPILRTRNKPATRNAKPETNPDSSGFLFKKRHHLRLNAYWSFEAVQVGATG